MEAVLILADNESNKYTFHLSLLLEVAGYITSKLTSNVQFVWIFFKENILSDTNLSFQLITY